MASWSFVLALGACAPKKAEPEAMAGPIGKRMTVSCSSRARGPRR